MLEYQKFDLPEDGLTMVRELDYYGKDLHKQGWRVVGLCTAKVGDDVTLYGVFRMTKDDVMTKALADVAAAEKAKSQAESAKHEAERELKDSIRRLGEMQTRIDELEEAQERQG